MSKHNMIYEKPTVKISDILIKHRITDIAIDSRKIAKDTAFFAIKGTVTDGNDYIEQAIAQGAKLIFTEQLADNPILGIYRVENIQEALAAACKWCFKNLPNKLIAVTGTCGKSSVVNYITQILESFTVPAASIGSLGILTNKYAKENNLSAVELAINTQDIVTFYKTLQKLKLLNIDIVAFEASSHGLLQGRLAGVEVDVAVFVSFSQDHLDYHHTMTKYFAAKTLLFKHNLKNTGIAVINRDIESEYYDHLVKTIKMTGAQIIDVGYDVSQNTKISDDTKLKNLVQINQINAAIDHQTIHFDYQNKSFSFTTTVLGNFQATNILMAAVIVSYIANIDPFTPRMLTILESVKAVSGRLERLNCKQNIYVDYCHKPVALEKVLTNLRESMTVPGLLVVVFGCGGERDKLKRPVMGSIANDLADIVIITDDNPRFEDAAAIRQDIIQGCHNKNKEIIEIPDRYAAIEHAINLLKENDILLIAGKGHETYQLIGEQKINFADQQVAYEIIEKINK